jgi:molybdopterin-containing oxidoreductase family membrane subunit
MRRSVAGRFVKDALSEVVSGDKSYFVWMSSLLLFIIMGLIAYGYQLQHGLVVTGMHDYVSWGLYISNFTFLVGLAAAAVMLVLPAYVLKDTDFSKAVLIGEAVAVAALVMCLLFVTVDLGSPERFWHLIPIIGYFNWPDSMLTWDVLVLNGYLALNLLVPAYILLSYYRGSQPNRNIYVPLMFLSVAWAFGIHLVTAFLYAGLPARPFWNTGLLGPRFLASAFAGGPAFIIVVLMMTKKFLRYEVRPEIINKLALIVTVAAQANLVMLVSEVFKEFYETTEHSLSAVYLFFGLKGHNQLVPWIWSAIILNVACTVTLSIHPLRHNRRVLIPVCILLFISIWIEKGMGLIVPGFIPSPLGEIVEYTPSFTEIGVTLGIWAIGLFLLTILVKVGVAVLKGEIRHC